MIYVMHVFLQKEYEFSQIMSTKIMAVLAEYVFSI